jgi:hypothetical protein
MASVSRVILSLSGTDDYDFASTKRSQVCRWLALAMGGLHRLQIAKAFRRLAVPHAPLCSINPACQPEFRRGRDLLLAQSPRHLNYMLKAQGQVKPVQDVRRIGRDFSLYRAQPGVSVRQHHDLGSIPVASLNLACLTRGPAGPEPWRTKANRVASRRPALCPQPPLSFARAHAGPVHILRQSPGFASALRRRVYMWQTKLIAKSDVQLMERGLRMN